MKMILEYKIGSLNMNLSIRECFAPSPSRLRLGGSSFLRSYRYSAPAGCNGMWCEVLFVTKLAWWSEALIFGISELASRIDFAEKISL